MDKECMCLVCGMEMTVVPGDDGEPMTSFCKTKWCSNYHLLRVELEDEDIEE